MASNAALAAPAARRQATSAEGGRIPSDESASQRDAPRLRLFVALDLPDAVRRELTVWRDRAFGGADELRPVRADALHVTLVFLGWQAQRDVEAIAGAMEKAAALPAPVLAVGELRAVPPRRARLLALDLVDADGRCAAVQAAAAGALERAGFYEPERRPFWAHVTVARVKRGQRLPAFTPEPPVLAPFITGQLTLYRSLLTGDGAIYEPVERWGLEWGAC